MRRLIVLALLVGAVGLAALLALHPFSSDEPECSNPNAIECIVIDLPHEDR